MPIYPTKHDCKIERIECIESLVAEANYPAIKLLHMLRIGITNRTEKKATVNRVGYIWSIANKTRPSFGNRNYTYAHIELYIYITKEKEEA